MSLFGAGLRHEHFSYLMEKPQTKIEWFEAITENFINTRGRPFEVLMEVRKDYPVSLHGVSLSIGVAEELDQSYLKKLKELIEIVDPLLVSDHLCWTGFAKNNLHNLLPLPYTKETLNFLIPRIQRVQEFLGREIALENLSAYVESSESTYTEWDFLREVSKQSGCKILLDINNIYVNSQNYGFDPKVYLDAIPDEAVAEIHLAGFSEMEDFLFDTHSTHAHPEVWKLYEHKTKTCKKAPTLFEWDEDIPDFAVLEAEVEKARNIWNLNDKRFS